MQSVQGDIHYGAGWNDSTGLTQAAGNDDGGSVISRVMIYRIQLILTDEIAIVFIDIIIIIIFLVAALPFPIIFRNDERVHCFDLDNRRRWCESQRLFQATGNDRHSIKIGQIHVIFGSKNLFGLGSGETLPFRVSVQEKQRETEIRSRRFLALHEWEKVLIE